MLILFLLVCAMLCWWGGWYLIIEAMAYQTQETRFNLPENPLGMMGHVVGALLVTSGSSCMVVAVQMLRS